MAHTKLNHPLQKKGDPKHPNNWRGLCLKESTAKIVSIIIAKRLLKKFD